MRGYSATLMDHFESPRNAGRMPDADAVGRADVNGRAPYITLYLRLSDQSVEHASFQSFGCGAAIAAGSVLTELITGRTLEQCGQLRAEDVAEALGGFPPGKKFCGSLAIRALKHALEQLPQSEDRS